MSLSQATALVARREIGERVRRRSSRPRPR